MKNSKKNPEWCVYLIFFENNWYFYTATLDYRIYLWFVVDYIYSINIKFSNIYL